MPFGEAAEMGTRKVITDHSTVGVLVTSDGSFTDIEGTEQLYRADSVIVSISQGPQDVIVKSTTGLVTDDRGLLKADASGNTSRPGIFGSGDVVHGARTVVEAVAHSKVVAETMHAYMQSLKED